MSWLVRIGIVFLVLAFCGFSLLALEKIRSGHGTDAYRSGSGAGFSYIGAGVTLLFIGVIVGVGYSLRWFRDKRTGKPGTKRRFPSSRA